MVYNTEAHIWILELLLFRGDLGKELAEFDSAPALSPRKTSRVSQQIMDGLENLMVSNNITEGP